MRINFNELEFKNTKSTQPLLCVCYNCNKSFPILKKYISHELKHIRGRNKFCTKKCYDEYQTNQIMTICKNCNKQYETTQSQLKKSKSGKHFCSKNCAAIYNNTHKKHGTRKSKLEKWLETKLTKKYPDLEIHFNRKDTINSELDIYIPSLKLAFELNGIFHYEPIYGVDKLSRIQNNDDRKFQACLEQGIELCIIDTSQQKYFKEQTSEKYFNIITNITNKSMNTLNS